MNTMQISNLLLLSQTVLP